MSLTPIPPLLLNKKLALHAKGLAQSRPLGYHRPVRGHTWILHLMLIEPRLVHNEEDRLTMSTTRLTYLSTIAHCAYNLTQTSSLPNPC
ncbi:hypothetical protein DACRYDRAFT_21903 [Dacryopinax primogenitus]|uniref:Uncharacterized protein n=1 Tax=Dacryopinax primogenitus (strain DJM 731) TaxID=1858805 RepID=M5GD61_DACPD|nr:uncharacterized protein DACRYDRAFT_21903 [Dacryopinax primogenitus]EJU02148.1 hypothetical protein DACRYDRAFT_21903 [Dacryopinax primogenitus]